MANGLKSVIYPVKDLAAAKALFGEVWGTTPYMDEPYYVGYSVDGLDVGLDPNGHAKGMTGPVAYWFVDDLEASLARMVERGGTVQQAPTPVGAGKSIALVKDGDGNLIGLMNS